MEELDVSAKPKKGQERIEFLMGVKTSYIMLYLLMIFDDG